MGVPAVVRQSALLDSAFANRSADYPIRPHRLVPATNEPGISAGTEPKGFAVTGSRPARSRVGRGRLRNVSHNSRRAGRPSARFPYFWLPCQL